MITCYLTENGKAIKSAISLPCVPNKGDVISADADYKSEHYLVKAVQYTASLDSVTLHVQVFPNQISAVNAIDGFRNSR